MKLEQVVPFGRSFEEYCLMFNLCHENLQRKILGVGDGPASFNAELTARGGKVTSVDPIYELDSDDIQSRFDEVVDDIINQVKNTPNDWVWSYHQNPEQLKQNRINTIDKFMADYQTARQTNRYQSASLPQLPFADNQFDLALCSHLLFLYSDHLCYQFHELSLREMLRVAPQVRIFPVITLMLEESVYLKPILTKFTEEGYETSLQKVEYEFQKGGNQMLVIKRKAS